MLAVDISSRKTCLFKMSAFVVVVIFVVIGLFGGVLWKYIYCCLLVLYKIASSSVSQDDPKLTMKPRIALILASQVLG